MMKELEKLAKAEALGFELIGLTFKDTLAYVQIQREKKEIIKRLVEENKDHAKRMGCEECWGWSPEICGFNCPDYHR